MSTSGFGVQVGVRAVGGGGWRNASANSSAAPWVLETRRRSRRRRARSAAPRSWRRRSCRSRRCPIGQSFGHRVIVTHPLCTLIDSRLPPTFTSNPGVPMPSSKFHPRPHPTSQPSPQRTSPATPHPAPTSSSCAASSTPTSSIATLPSGSVAIQFDVRTPSGPRHRPVRSTCRGSIRQPTLGRRSLLGEQVVVIGTVQRRFFRVAGATQSRTEVVADQVIPARRARSVRSAIAAAARSLGD